MGKGEAMSKYTEAIIDKVDLIQRCERSLVYHLNNSSLFPIIKKELDEARLDLEALEIADRLEQADAELHDTILYDLDRTVGIPNSEIFIQGYNQALADIRGDAE